MKLSHSKLSALLSCPASFKLSYIEGISKKEEKPALYVGSAVHWGIEHNTEDLSEYFGNPLSYTRDQLLAESMVHGYLKHKDEIFDMMLTDTSTGEKLKLVDEMHELYVTGKLKSSIEKVKEHDFVGIIDLLLLTDKGFIVIDYKTSSFEPHWDQYLDQIYRYIFMLKTEFPEIPVIKIGIVNLRKTGIRQKKNENESQFLNRLRFEYDVNDDNLINYHEFNRVSLDDNLINSYIENLSRMADAGQTIVDNKMFYINYGAANGQYGKSDFWDIIYKTPDAHVLYNIRDKVWNEDEQKFDERRDCLPIDMLAIDHDNLVNHFETYKRIVEQENGDFSKYITDEQLLKLYKITLDKVQM